MKVNNKNNNEQNSARKKGKENMKIKRKKSNTQIFYSTHGSEKNLQK